MDRVSRRQHRSGFDDPEAEAHFLRAQLRAGEVDLRRLQLWSYFGHPAAELVLDERALERPTELRPWFVGLGRFGTKPIALVAIALAERALPLVRISEEDLAPYAYAICAALPVVLRGDLDVYSLRSDFVHFWQRTSNLRRSQGYDRRSPHLVVERAVRLVITLQEAGTKRGLGDLELLGRSALAIPGWTDALLLSDLFAEVLPQLLEEGQP